MGFLIHTLVTAFAFWCTTQLISGISFSGPLNMIIAAVVFGIVNALIRPIALVLSLPLTILTLGLFILVVNAAMLWLTAKLMPGMQIASFGAAFLGAIIIAIVSWIVGRLVAGQQLA
ncbi:phage holin family protein [Roseomonas hellenica]|uniref:Phage holin family protein n=1 Tax=Plastoroseomonas hellenica TaxID=2687306 RepID=A0ABS5EZS3_9PROT|nr:phage holin family protein [Plastoroseomonas hellenica]MBR0665782.1 phage holin family protein [Plastoroseomonas hellenica]